MPAFAMSSAGEYELAGFPVPAYCAYRSSWERRSHVGGALCEQRLWQMRLHCSHSTALFLTLWRQTLQTTADSGVSYGTLIRWLAATYVSQRWFLRRSVREGRSPPRRR